MKLSLWGLLALLSVDGCRAQENRVFWKGRSGAFTIQWTAANLRAYRTAAPGKAVIDLRREALEDWKRLVKDGEKVESATYTYRLLSAVGPILSVEESEGCDCGGAHPSAVTRFRAVDMSNGKAVRLETLFEASVLYGALAADPIVRQAIPREAHPVTLDSLLRTIDSQIVPVGECGYFFTKDLLANFAFYDVQGPKVAVRVSLSHAEETCRGQMVQIGLLLPIPRGLQLQLREAKGRAGGRLMVQGKALGEDGVTEFTYSNGSR